MPELYARSRLTGEILAIVMIEWTCVRTGRQGSEGERREKASYIHSNWPIFQTCPLLGPKECFIR